MAIQFRDPVTILYFTRTCALTQISTEYKFRIFILEELRDIKEAVGIVVR